MIYYFGTKHIDIKKTYYFTARSSSRIRKESLDCWACSGQHRSPETNQILADFRIKENFILIKLDLTLIWCKGLCLSKAIRWKSA